MEGTAVALLSAVIPFLLFTAGIVGGKAQDISAHVSAPIKNSKKSGKHLRPPWAYMKHLLCACDRLAIDQGIAYMLILVALLLTYFLH